jgi:hypothetical protein
MKLGEGSVNTVHTTSGAAKGSRNVSGQARRPERRFARGREGGDERGETRTARN